MRSEGLIARTIALLSPRLTRERLRAIVLIQLAEHADRPGKEQLERRLMAVDEVQLCVEIAGRHEMLVLLDCASMADLTETVEALFAQTPTVRRYETHIVKREVKFALRPIDAGRGLGGRQDARTDHLPDGQLAFFAAIQRSIFCSRMASGSEPVIST